MTLMEDVKERVFLEHASSMPPEFIARSDYRHLSREIKRQKRRVSTVAAAGGTADAAGGTADAAGGTAEDPQRNARNAWKNCR